MNTEIIFSKDGKNSFLSLFNDNEKQSINLVDLIHKSNQYSIYKLIPRNFIITTKNVSCLFNLDMLKCSSSTILQQITNDPNNLSYHLNIDDEYNVLSKFEELYLGKKVYFNKENILTCQQIVEILKIENCPKYMKPLSSQSRQNSSNDEQSDYKLGVQVDSTSFKNFLSKKLQRSFTIITKKNSYKCTLCGVYSSLAIQKLLLKQPTLNQFIYDFDDEFNEFQSICDFFNFQDVKIISNKVIQLYKIANDLKIEIILSILDDYIKRYENVTKIINQQNSIIQSIDDLFELLYKIKEYSIDYVKIKIIESFWITTKENVLELAAFILQVIKTDFLLHSSILELLIELDKEANDTNFLNILLPFICKKLFESFGQNLSNCAFIYNLYQKGIITKDQILYQLKFAIQIKHEKNSSLRHSDGDFINHIFVWFLPEIIEINQFYGSFQYLKSEIKDFILKFWPDKIDAYKKMRNYNEPDDELTKSLRYDDVDTFQAFVSRNEIDINASKVPYNIFEEYVPNGYTGYLNYSSAYGSIKCFKYLLLNQARIDDNTFEYAIFGCNIEIIKIVDQLFPDSKNTEYLKKYQFNASISKHQNDVFDWILGEKLSNASYDLLDSIVLDSALNGNVHSLIEVIDMELNIDYKKIISNSMANGFYRLSRLIMEIYKVGNNEKDGSLKINYSDPIFFDNLSIFKLALLNDKDPNILNYLYKAVEYECNIITQYIVEALKIDINEEVLKKLFFIASKNKSSLVFNYLLNVFNQFVISLFQQSEWTEKILIESCTSGNIDIAKFCIDSIVTNENSNFTKSFITSAILGRKEICQYLFDKKVNIRYEQILANIIDLVYIDVPTFAVIAANCPHYIKEKLFNLFVQSSLPSHNTNLLNYLLKEKAPHDKALIRAVQYKDLKAINIILKYDSRPSFINKMSMDGTALNIAVKLNNLAIVQRLLSLPGINPNLCDSKGMTPLMNVDIQNIEMINLFFDFYGNKIQFQTRQLNKLLQQIFEKLQSNQFDSKIFLVLDRFLEVQSIDTDYYFYQYKIFENIFKTGNVEFIQNLLEMSHFNINIASPSNGNTLLIDAIENNSLEIAEILIKSHQMNINQSNYNNETALTSAVKLKQVRIINLIINDDKFDHEESLLNYAFFIADFQIAKLLINVKYLDVNYTVYDVNFKYLNSGMPKAKTKEKLFYETALMNATSKNDIEKIDLIIHHQSFNKDQSSYQEAIYTAIKNKSFEIFKKLMDMLKDINKYEYEDQSILPLAAKYNNIEIVKEILNVESFNPSKADFIDAFMSTFLITNESYEMMNMLINYDKEHNHFIDFSKLFFNSLRLNYNCPKLDWPNIGKIVDLLLQNGVDPNLADINNAYPLERAIFLNNEFALSLLKSNKIDLKIKMNQNRGVSQKEPPMKTFLHLAAQKDSCILKELLSKGIIDVNSEDSNGETPLIIACKNKKAENIKLLFKEKNLDYLHCNKKGRDALKIVFGPDVEPIQDRETYLQQLLSGFSHK